MEPPDSSVLTGNEQEEPEKSFSSPAALGRQSAMKIATGTSGEKRQVLETSPAHDHRGLDARVASKFSGATLQERQKRQKWGSVRRKC